ARPRDRRRPRRPDERDRTSLGRGLRGRAPGPGRTTRSRLARAATRLFGGYVFDLDGTLYLGESLIPGAARTVAWLREAGARIVFLTNNPTRLLADYAEKL